MPRKSSGLRVSASRRKSAPKKASVLNRDDDSECSPKRQTPHTSLNTKEAAIEHQDKHGVIPQSSSRVTLKRKAAFDDHPATKRARPSSPAPQIERIIPRDESLAVSAPLSVAMIQEKLSLDQAVENEVELTEVELLLGDLEELPNSSTQGSYVSVDDLYARNQSSGAATSASSFDDIETVYTNLEHPRPLLFIQSPLTFDGFFRFDGILCDTSSDFAFWGTADDLDTQSEAARVSERSFWEIFGGVSFEQKASESFVDILFPDFVDLDLDVDLPSFTASELDATLDLIKDLNQPWSVV